MLKMTGIDAISGGSIDVSGGGQLIASGSSDTIEDSTSVTIESGGLLEVSGSTLTVNTGSNTMVNAGSVEAATGAMLAIDSNVNNAGGTVEATGAGAVVELNNVTIAGGTLSTGDPTDHTNGLIAVEAAGGTNTSILDGSANTVTVAGYIQVEAGANLELKGTIDDTGTIEVDPVSPATTNALEIGGTVTLNGGGTVTLDSVSDQDHCRVRRRHSG